MAPRLSRAGMFTAVAVALAFTMSTTSSGQNLASNKAFFSAGYDDVVLVQGAAPTTILEGSLKTSSVGDLMIGVSLECALWTGTLNSATRGGGKSESKSRAAVNVTVYVDNVEAEPGQVVFCDREQEVKLQFSTDDPEIIYTDTITLEMFLKTKNANHFNFFIPNPGNGVHQIVVKASGTIDEATAAPSATRAAFGKRTLVIEEFNSSN